MKIGQVAVSTATGLGIQGKSFYDNMHPDHVLMIDISEANGAEQHPDWYPNAQIAKGFMIDDDIRKFMDNNEMDLIYITESAYSFYVYDYAHYRGKKVVVQHNFEFLDWISNPQLPHPDALISPSMWHYDDTQKYCDEYNLLHTYLHCPVDRKQFPFREIKQAKTFIHNAGKPAIHDRNGTYSVIEASKLVKSDIKIKIHFQGEQNLIHQRSDAIQDFYDYAEDHGDMSKLILETSDNDNPADIYKQGDVMVYPRRYGGNSLVLNEAVSCGLPVIMTGISPNDYFLPKEWLVGAFKKDEFTPRAHVDIYEAYVKELATKIDEFANMGAEEMLVENKRANALADTISWDTLKPQYESFFEEVVSQPKKT